MTIIKPPSESESTLTICIIIKAINETISALENDLIKIMEDPTSIESSCNRIYVEIYEQIYGIFDRHWIYM